MLKLRLAARALIEWKEPPTSPRYKGVVEELVSVHPFAARVGFSPDNPAFQHDTRGVVLWFLSETLGDTDTAARLKPSGYEGDEKLKLLRKYRAQHFDKVVYGLRGKLDEKLGYGLTARDMLFYITNSLAGAGRLNVEMRVTNYFLAAMIGQDRETNLHFFKRMAELVFGMRPNDQDEGAIIRLLNIITLNPVRFSLIIVSLGVFVLAVMLALAPSSPAWPVTAAFFLMLLVDNLTTRRIYHLFRRAFVNSKLISLSRSEDYVDFSLNFYGRCLASRCCQEVTFFACLLKDEENGMPPGVVLSLIESYPVEHIRAVTELLGDPEISRQDRTEIFAWLCRVKIDERPGEIGSRYRLYDPHNLLENPLDNRRDM